MKILAHITTVILSVLALDPCILFLYAVGQVAQTSCNKTCIYDAPNRHANCKNLDLNRIPPQCSVSVFLDFRRNNLQFIDQNSFARYWDLRFLFLEYNNIRNITPGAFSACRELRQLYLQKNPLVFLQRDVFLGATSLQQLYLTDAGLKIIEGGGFNGLSSIQRIYLNNNQLRTLPTNVFHNLRTLQILMLSNNNLETLHSDQFQGLRQLKYLEIQDNRLTRLESGLFRGLVSLTSLNISQNEISRVENGALDFTDLVNLEEIDMSNNNIEAVANFSNGIVNIPKVFLTGNPLHCGCENQVLVDWYWERLGVDPSIGTDRRFDVICSSPQELIGIPLKNVTLTPCKGPIIPYVPETNNGDSADLIHQVAASSNRDSNNATHEDMYMFVGIAVLLLCVTVVLVTGVGVYVKCKRSREARRREQDIKDEASRARSPSITENPLEEYEEEGEEHYERLDTVQEAQPRTRRLRLISEKSQDSGLGEGSLMDSPESDDTFPPSYPPPPPPPPHAQSIPMQTPSYAQPYVQTPPPYIQSPPSQPETEYIPVFHSPNGVVYICTQCPHHMQQSGQLTHSQSVSDYQVSDQYRPHSESLPPNIQPQRQNSFPLKHLHRCPSLTNQSNGVNYIHQATSQHPEPSLSCGNNPMAVPDSNVQVTTPLLDGQTNVPYPHNEGCPQVPLLQTNIAPYSTVDMIPYPSTNPFSSSHTRPTNHPRRVSFSDEVGKGFKP